MDRSYLFVPGNRPERRVDLDLTRHINGFTLMLGLKLTPQMSFAAVSARRWTKGEGPNSDLMQTVLYESRSLDTQQRNVIAKLQGDYEAA